MNSVNRSYHQVGSYGWVDANGILRVYDYIADDNGYRVTKDSAINLDEDVDSGQIIDDSLAMTFFEYSPAKIFSGLLQE